MKNSYLGISFTLLSALIYAVQAALIKVFSLNLSIPMIVFSQSLVALLILLPLMFYQRRNWQRNLFKTQVLLQHLARAVFSLGISYFLFISITHVSLVDGVLLANTSPFFVPFILFIFARQKFQHALWLPLGFGFLGVVMILKPDANIMSPYAIVALGAGLSMALSIIMVRKISAHDSGVTTVFYYFLFSSLIAGVISIPFWQVVSIKALLVLCLIGILFFFVQYLLVVALAHIQAQSFSVLYYANVIFAAAIGMLFFAESHDGLTMLGILLTIASAIVIIRLQTQRQKVNR
ncbi:DMT family transporter [Caedibacter taeniospiralis]|uniref:DMT family transporter n=1 Tax=Caedibacter taeniospiralis TaxID=28907 RepID=UPI000C273503|nr:DMT family transporter [Caedibacter taeniospiralis]